MRTTSRLVTAATAATLATGAALACASPASAASAPKAPARYTMAMAAADDLGAAIRADGNQSRAVKAWRAENEFTAAKVTGFKDGNRDGRDDDKKVRVRFGPNLAVLDLAHKKGGSFRVLDGGYVFKDERAVLKEAAQNFDAELRILSGLGIDTWHMDAIYTIKFDLPGGVKVVSDHDGNDDGYDDDGRLTFLKGGKAVTLVIGNTPDAKGVVQYGATWQNKAPKRKHVPHVRLNRAARAASAYATAVQLSKVIQATSANEDKSMRDMKVLRDAAAILTESSEDPVKVTGIVDSNKDGRDDDGKVWLRAFDGRHVLRLDLPNAVAVAPKVTVVKR